MTTEHGKFHKMEDCREKRGLSCAGGEGASVPPRFIVFFDNEFLG